MALGQPEITEIPYTRDTLIINTTFRKLPWNGNIYLLSHQQNFFYGYPKNQNDYENFAYYYNAGLEPTYHGSYLVKEHDQKSKSHMDLNLSAIPSNYRNLFLDEPIEATIVSTEYVKETELENEHWVVTLDKGKDDGVIENLLFQSQNGELSMEPIEILPKRTRGKIYSYDNPVENAKKGVVLKSWWPE